MRRVKLIPEGNLLPFILITSLFFMWGLANNMTDTLLAAFKKILSLSDFQTSFVQMSFYGAYFCLALPAAIFIQKFTYKAGVLVGLGLFVSGAMLFYPASITMTYGHFLAALFILAGGLSILETSANPYIIAMGPEETGTERLNLAQSFNPIGSISGVILSKLFILSHLNQAGAEERAVMDSAQLKEVQSAELSAVMGPYVGVAVFLVLLWIAIAATRMPRASDSGIGFKLGASLKRLVKNSNYMWGVVAQFFYVGAQLGVWSFTIRYIMKELNLNEDQSATYYLVALILFTGSRFIFTFLMNFFRPKHLLTTAAIIAGVCTTIVIFGHGKPAVYALVFISANMSLMFPTIFGLASRGLGQDTKIGGSGLIMAILGGAVMPVFMGLISDNTGSINIAYSVPLVCFVVIIIYSIYGGRKKSVVFPEAH